MLVIEALRKGAEVYFVDQFREEAGHLPAYGGVVYSQKSKCKSYANINILEASISGKEVKKTMLKI